MSIGGTARGARRRSADPTGELSLGDMEPGEVHRAARQGATPRPRLRRHRAWQERPGGGPPGSRESLPPPAVTPPPAHRRGLHRSSSFSVCRMPAAARSGESAGMPSSRAILSAVLNPIPRMSRASRYGFSADGGNRRLAVGLEDLDRIGRGDAVALQEQHDLANLAAARPRPAPIRSPPLWADAPEPRQGAQAWTSMTWRVSAPKASTSRFAKTGPMPLIMPDPRYF